MTIDRYFFIFFIKNRYDIKKFSSKKINFLKIALIII